jgi:hypothetical protein
MEIYRAVLDRAKLAAMPENERTLLLLLGHASNEINVLSKLILMMQKDDPPSLVFDHVEAGQTFILMRLLTGKLHEAWELFRTRVQSDPAISKTYLPQLGPRANTALQALKRHFGQGSVLTAIRNKVAFHYSDKEDLREASFQALPPSEPLQFYLSKTVGNTFYHASLMEGFDLRTVLAHPFDLKHLLRAKLRALNLDAEPYFSISQLLSK